MDARIEKALVSFCTICVALFGWQSPSACSQTYQVKSENFVVYAADRRLAQQASALAEKYRRELSIDWLGYEIGPWQQHCPIEVKIGPHAGGETSFAFVQGPSGKGVPVSWQMKIYGPPDRLLDAVLPHEVTHTIFATHFGKPLPRWADEGACTTVEHESERAKNHRMLIEFLTGTPSRGIPFNRMFTMKQYPHDILPLYAQGYSVAKYLINQKGRQHFVKFLEHGMSREQSGYDTSTWDEATQTYYGFDDLSDLQVSWMKWVRNGSPLQPQVQIAAAGSAALNSDARVDPSDTFAVVSPRDSKSGPTENTIANSATPTAKLNTWYSRESRAKQAIASVAKAPESAPSSSTFRPGSIKRIDRGKYKPSAENRIWR